LGWTIAGRRKVKTTHTGTKKLKKIVKKTKRRKSKMHVTLKLPGSVNCTLGKNSGVRGEGKGQQQGGFGGG
jgi:hypothetical protein